MSDVRAELEELRRDINEIRRAMGMSRSPHDVPDDNPAVGLDRDLKAQLQQKGRSAGIAVMRVAVTKRLGEREQTTAGTTTDHWTAFEDLPSEEKVAQNLEAYAANPLTVRALYGFLRAFFDGKPMRLSQSELSRDLGVGEAELEMALQPLIEKEVVKRKRSADSPEPQYELAFPDPVLMLLLT
jgi:hypothetical protein